MGSISLSQEAKTPPVIWLAGIWHLLLAVASLMLSLQIFQMEKLTILGKPADLGQPVQIFAALIVLLPGIIGVIGSGLMLRRKIDGRYLSLVVNTGVMALSLFALAGIWGFYDSFERLVDMLMANFTITYGFVIAYVLYYLAGRISAGSSLRRILEMGAIGLAMLALMIILFRGTLGNAEFAQFNILNGLIFVLTRYITPETAVMAWAVTVAALISGGFIWRLLALGTYFDELPDQRAAWQGWFMLAPNIIGFLLFFAGPLLLSFYLSFTDSSVGQVPQVTWFENYSEILSLEIATTTDQEVFSQNVLSFGYAQLGEFQLGDTRYVIGAKDRQFWVSLRNTLFFALMLLPLAIIPAIGMALILNSKLPGVKFFRAVYFLPSVAAVVGTALIWRWMYTPTIGFINYALSTVAGWFGAGDVEILWLSDPAVVLFSIVLLAAWQVVGYNTVLLLAGLQGIPNVLYEAAQIDGANPWQRFWNVTLPMLQPTMFFVIITTMVTALQVFNEPYALFPARPIPENATTAVYYMYTQGFNQFNFGYASSVAWILFFIIFGLTLLQFRVNRSEAYE